MRSYPRNSPEAAARIVALVLISDGHVGSSEYDALTRLDGVNELALAPQHLRGIVQTLCEDLLMAGFDGHSILALLGDGPLASLLAEVDEPQLRSKVLRLAVAAAKADRHRSEGEASVLDAIRRQWDRGQAAPAPAPPR